MSVDQIKYVAQTSQLSAKKLVCKQSERTGNNNSNTTKSKITAHLPQKKQLNIF